MVLTVLRLALGLAASLLLLASCATYKTVRTSGPEAVTAPADPDALKIAGYTTIDGVYHLFEGTVRVEGDSLAFFKPGAKEKGLELAKPEQSFKLATADVFSVKQVTGTNYVLTTLLVVGMSTLVLFMVAAGAMASDESMM